MADRVVIVDARRGPSRLTSREMAQMAGRAGRSHDVESAFVDVVVSERDHDYAREAILNPSDWSVDSSLYETDECAFHVLPSIVEGKVRCISDVAEWYNKSFAAFQGYVLDADSVVERLIEQGMILSRKGRFVATELAETAVDYYLRPVDVDAWVRNFAEVVQRGLEQDDGALVWALATTPSQNNCGYTSKWDLSNACTDMVSASGFSVPGEYRVAALVWWRLLGGPSCGEVKYLVAERRRDYGRVDAVLRVANEVNEWGIDEAIDELEVRVKHGVTSDLVKLCRLEGIGKGHALRLYNMGAQSVDDLMQMTDEIMGTGDEAFISAVREGLSNAFRRKSRTRLRKGNGERVSVRSSHQRHSEV